MALASELKSLALALASDVKCLVLTSEAEAKDLISEAEAKGLSLNVSNFFHCTQRGLSLIHI